MQFVFDLCLCWYIVSYLLRSYPCYLSEIEFVSLQIFCVGLAFDCMFLWTTDMNAWNCDDGYLHNTSMSSTVKLWSCWVQLEMYWMGFNWRIQMLEIGFMMWDSSLKQCICIMCTTSCWWMQKYVGSISWTWTEKLHCQNLWDLWEYNPNHWNRHPKKNTVCSLQNKCLLLPEMICW
jgi:hypothetical protein